ncbi:MAG: GTP-binding protein [Candidatus Heimdallarchaeota archaeon]|nr:GTP-binding protein [Candidatus Heimdallarchaeota archaeon]
MEEPSAFFKVLIVGDGAVGKTSICTHATTQEFFSDYHLTVGCDFFIKRIYVKNTSVTLQIFDIGGQDQFLKIRPAFAGGAMGLFLAFDITRRDSFYNLEDWYDSVKEGLHPKAPKVLVATKYDLISEREVWKEDVETFMGILGIDGYVETSSLTGDGVDEAFEMMAKMLLARFSPEEYSKKAQRTKFLEGLYQRY